MSDPAAVAAFGVLLVSLSGLQEARTRTAAGKDVALFLFVTGAFVAWGGIGWKIARMLISI